MPRALPLQVMNCDGGCINGEGQPESDVSLVPAGLLHRSIWLCWLCVGCAAGGAAWQRTPATGPAQQAHQAQRAHHKDNGHTCLPALAARGPALLTLVHAPIVRPPLQDPDIVKKRAAALYR